MAKVEVLIEGYVRETEGGESVQPTISLVRSKKMVMVVDPGILRKTSDLLDALKERDLKAADVTHVFITHHHVDHTRNVGMFPAATVYDSDSLYRGDLWAEHEGDGFFVAPGVQIIKTPGHTNECASLVVETDDGVVVLTHAWWFSDMTPVEDPLADDQAELERSRERILAIADTVIPGHGGPFSCKA
ncbi:MBL fold metallo-hydrolase [Catellatospora citrea]|uniref:MBL fold metallo-hydrolase n=1 Tax=Catellatospora citrea TaxID=53366 RepID=UPI0033CC1FBD